MRNGVNTQPPDRDRRIFQRDHDGFTRIKDGLVMGTGWGLEELQTKVESIVRLRLRESLHEA